MFFFSTLFSLKLKWLVSQGALKTILVEGEHRFVSFEPNLPTVQKLHQQLQRIPRSFLQSGLALWNGLVIFSCTSTGLSNVSSFLWRTSGAGQNYGLLLTVATYSAPTYFSQIKLTGENKKWTSDVGFQVFRSPGNLNVLLKVRILDLWYHSLLKEPASLAHYTLINWVISKYFIIAVLISHVLKKTPTLFLNMRGNLPHILHYIKIFLSMKSSHFPL